MVSIGYCLDGGSTKGTLKDATGLELHFMLDNGMSSTTRGRWYIGEDYNSGKAELLEKDDEQIDAISAICIEWVKRVTTPSELERLVRIERDSIPQEASSMEEHYQRYVVRFFMRPGKSSK